MGRLDGKVAFVTGGAGGIGRAICERFLAEGASVLATDLAPPQAGDASSATAAGRAAVARCDVTDPESVQAAIGAAMRRFGRIDVLCNVAGGSTDQDGLVTEVADEEFWRAIKLNLFGTFLVCKYGIREMVRTGGGSVINFSSLMADLPKPGRTCYISAKGGVVSLTRTLAADYAAHGVRANAIAPGRTVTPRTRHSIETTGGLSDKLGSRHILGLIDPADVADTALHLASDESRRVTGQVLYVDSGARVG